MAAPLVVLGLRIFGECSVDIAPVYFERTLIFGEEMEWVRGAEL